MQNLLKILKLIRGGIEKIPPHVYTVMPWYASIAYIYS